MNENTTETHSRERAQATLGAGRVSVFDCREEEVRYIGQRAIEGIVERLRRWLTIPWIVAEIQTGNSLLDVVTDTAILAVRVGRGREVLELIEQSDCAMALECLSVGIRIRLGEDVVVAQEIYEVGRDVASLMIGMP